MNHKNSDCHEPCQCGGTQECTPACECDPCECDPCECGEDTVETLREQLAAAKDQMLRAAAEYDNFKKRSQREREQLAEFIKAQTIKSLMQPIDNLQRATQSPSDSDEYIKGISMIIRQIFDSLQNVGLEEIDPVNQPFDPQFHEAVAHERSDKYPDNTVIEVLQKGYKVGDSLIRPAMVKVAN